MVNKATPNTVTVFEESEQFYHQVLDKILAFYTCDMDGYLKLFNRSAVTVWGIEPEAGKTKWCGSWKIFLPDGSPIPLDTCPMAMIIKERREVNSSEVIVERPDGTRSNVLIQPKILKDSNGVMIGAVNMLLDITQLRATEEKLRISETKQFEREAAFKIGIQELEQARDKLAFQDAEKGRRENELIIANRDVEFESDEKRKRAAELILTKADLAFQKKEKEKRVAELRDATEELFFQSSEKGKRAAELAIANEELAFQINEKGKRVAELVVVQEELAFQIEEKETQSTELTKANEDLALQKQRTSELFVTNSELSFQNREKEKRALELIIANGELAFQNGEKIKHASELIIANDELAFQINEKGKRAAELIIANGELAFHNGEKEKRAAELFIANAELVFQNSEKEKRAAELVIANRELVFQNSEKEKRAAELIIANRELAFQNIEKGKRAAELVFANGELAFQIGEKEKRTAELVIANKELALQNEEKEKRAAELVVANNELAYQNREKEKRAAELILVNKELEAFSYVSSHDLQEPLRKIQTLSSRILDIDRANLSTKGQEYLERMHSAASRMRLLIDDLLTFSQLSIADRRYEDTDLNIIVDEVKNELKEIIEERQVTIDSEKLCTIKIIPFQFRQILFNLINNALKFSKPDVPPHITIRSVIGKGIEFNEEKLLPEKNYCHFSISDNGIGFDPEHKDRIFEVFQRLHDTGQYAGTGIGLAIVKKVIDNHDGIINALGALNEGSTFNIYIPVSPK
jgi:PAS domain S-box-containing protein